MTWAELSAGLVVPPRASVWVMDAISDGEPMRIDIIDTDKKATLARKRLKPPAPGIFPEGGGLSRTPISRSELSA